MVKVLHPCVIFKKRIIKGSVLQADLFRHICIVLHPLFFSRTVHSQESRIFDYEVPLAAKNENMATGSEPAVEREWM